MLKDKAFQEFARERMDANSACYDTEDCIEYKRRYQLLLEELEVESDLLEEIKDLFTNISFAEALVSYQLGFHDGVALKGQIK